MINKISFTGNKNNLVKNIKNTVERYEYVGADKVYSNAERLVVETQNKISKPATNNYFSPFTSIIMKPEALKEENIGLVYAKAHGKNIDYCA